MVDRVDDKDQGRDRRQVEWASVEPAPQPVAWPNKAIERGRHYTLFEYCLERIMNKVTGKGLMRPA